MALLSRRRQQQTQAQTGGQQPLRIVAPPGARLVLHVGCGLREEQPVHPSFQGPEWQELRLDIDPAVDPDIVASITEMSPVPDACVDAVYSHHNIEHVFWHEVSRALDEFLRVLRPGGEVLLATPDLQAVARAIASGRLEDPLYKSASGNIAALDVVYGHRPRIAQGRDHMAHRTGFTRGTLTRRLGQAGFVDIRVTRNTSYELWAQARRPT